MNNKANKYELKGKMFLWSADSKTSRHFLPVDKSVAAKIKANFGRYAVGFGSLPVRARVGDSEWLTSIFPDSKTNTYVLPVKKKIRKDQSIKAGDNVRFTIKIGG